MPFPWYLESLSGWDYEHGIMLSSECTHCFPRARCAFSRWAFPLIALFILWFGGLLPETPPRPEPLSIPVIFPKIALKLIDKLDRIRMMRTQNSFLGVKDRH